MANQQTNRFVEKGSDSVYRRKMWKVMRKREERLIHGFRTSNTWLQISTDLAGKATKLMLNQGVRQHCSLPLALPEAPHPSARAHAHTRTHTHTRTHIYTCEIIGEWERKLGTRICLGRRPYFVFMGRR
jgi:hypothetical protein